MRVNFSIPVAALCLVLLASISAFPQSTESRPRRVSSAQEMKTLPIAYKPGNELMSRDAGRTRGGSAETATLESSVPREGLQFYFEVRTGGLAELARAANAL